MFFDLVTLLCELSAYRTETYVCISVFLMLVSALLLMMKKQEIKLKSHQ